jgi:protein-disulfide isomerase
MTKPAKKRTSTSQRSRRAAQRRRSSSPLRTYGLIAAIAVVAIGLVAVLILLGGGDDNSSQPGEVSMDKSMGAEDAPVVVVEYADFQCPYCGQFSQSVEAQLREEYVGTGQVRFVYRHFAFIGDESTWAAEASECANEQGHFWEYHDKLFQEQSGENTGTFSRDNLKQFAADLGLDTTAFNECLDSEKYRSKVEQENRNAQNLRINSTPTVVVNNRTLSNPLDYAALKAAVEAALAAD